MVGAHILVPLAPGVLLSRRELQRGVTAFMPASGSPVTLGDTEGGGGPACGAYPHLVLIRAAGRQAVAQDIAASRLRNCATAKLVAVSDIA